MTVFQVWIAVFGVAAIWLSQDQRERFRKWACVCGLLAQPAWLAETITAQQYPITALCLLYTWSWARGFNAYWVQPWRAAR